MRGALGDDESEAGESTVAISCLDPGTVYTVNCWYGCAGGECAGAEDPLAIESEATEIALLTPCACSWEGAMPADGTLGVGGDDT